MRIEDLWRRNRADARLRAMNDELRDSAQEKAPVTPGATEPLYGRDPRTVQNLNTQLSNGDAGE